MILSPLNKTPDLRTNGEVRAQVSPSAQASASPPSHSAQQDSVPQQTRTSSSLISRNVTVGGHRTSVRLEPEMWSALRELCLREHLSIHDIATAVAQRKPANTSLTAALRVFIMAYFRAAATEDGHSKAGHGPGGSFMTSWGRPSMNGTHKSNDYHTPMRRFAAIVTR